MVVDMLFFKTVYPSLLARRPAFAGRKTYANKRKVLVLQKVTGETSSTNVGNAIAGWIVE